MYAGAYFFGGFIMKNVKRLMNYSRHYYDLYRMAQTPVKDVAFSHIDLLKTVVDFKMKFYPRAWAKYPEATPGTLKLIPPEYRFPARKKRQ